MFSRNFILLPHKLCILFLIFILYLNYCTHKKSKNKSANFTNSAPVAHAGADQTVTAGDLVELDGSESYDSEDDSLIYNWSFMETPEQSTAVLSETSNSNPSFIANHSGHYVVKLVVSDGTQESMPDEVNITVLEKTDEEPLLPEISIIDNSSYYYVTINVNNGTHKKIGELYAEKILEKIPDIEYIVDSYIAEIASTVSIYNVFISRVNDIRPQIPQEYQDEIDGMASKFAQTTENIRGDNKLSLDELYMVNLLPDVGRSTQCSALSVFGSLSETEKTITARTLDWNGGTQNQLPTIHAIITFKDGTKSFTSIGYLGFMGILSAFNDNKIFAAILDSSTGQTYSSVNKRSYPFDIRYALENFTTLDDVASYMTDSSRQYTYGHLIFLSDSGESRVVENDLSDLSHRRVREFNSTLNSGVSSWPSPSLDQSIGAVNSFVLNGNHNNHTIYTANTARWASIISQLGTYSDPLISVKEMKNIISFDNNNGPGSQATGDLYSSGAQHVLVFQPDSLTLDIYFRPRTGLLDSDPVFSTLVFDY
jgi:hypothetical protein